MSILNLNSAQGRSPRLKNTKIWMGVGLLVAVLGFGTTLAANISINGSNTTEFGQGYQSTVYCGAGLSNSYLLNISPTSSFSYSDNRFNLTGVKVSGIPRACSGANFVLRFYSSSGSAMSIANSNVDLLNIYWSDSATPVYPIAMGGLNGSFAANASNPCDGKKSPSSGSWSGTTTSNGTGVDATSGVNVTGSGALLSTSRTSYVSACSNAVFTSVIKDTTLTNQTTSGSGSFTIAFVGSPLALASSLSKITIETQDDQLVSATNSPTLVACTVASKASCSSNLGLFYGNYSGNSYSRES